jgi:rare lipoprotein A
MKVYAAVALALLSCQPSFAECGVSSYYSAGARTADGKRFDPFKISAAHRTLPFGTRVIVRDLQTGRSIIVIINDRGPFFADRIIDLSQGARNALGITDRDGIAVVCLDVVSYGSGKNDFKDGPVPDINHTSRKGLEHYARSTARVRYAHQGRSRYRHRRKG